MALKFEFNAAETRAHSYVRELLWLLYSNNEEGDPSLDSVSDERAAMVIDGLKRGGFVISTNETRDPPLTPRSTDEEVMAHAKSTWSTRLEQAERTRRNYHGPLK